eukprot:scaffold303_cov410-Prasinococcus_capsulatus_cf.AAC.3
MSMSPRKTPWHVLACCASQEPYLKRVWRLSEPTLGILQLKSMGPAYVCILFLMRALALQTAQCALESCYTRGP